MADLTGETPLPADMVTCGCGLQWDRNVFSQCTKCVTNLWDLDVVSPRRPETGQSPMPGSTVLEGDSSQRASIDVLVCGRRLTLVEGCPLRLGRQDDWETSEVFREAMNISREHAVLRFDRGRLLVTDTGSSNGTYVDDQRLPPNHEYELREGQRLRLASNVAVDILWTNK